MSYLRQSLALVVGSVFALSAAAAEPDPMALLLSKDHWAGFKWEAAEQSDLWRMPGWVPDPDNDPLGVEGDQDRVVSSWGHVFNISLESGYSPPSNPSRVTLATHPVRRAQCLEFARRFSDALGTPVENEVAIYTRMGPSQYIKTDSIEHQWDVGDTRMSAACVAILSDRDEGLDPPKYVWEMSFEPLASAKRLVPKFALTCSRQMALVGEPGTASDIGPISLWIDPGKRVALTPDFTLFASHVQMGANSIRFEHVDGSKSWRYTLDTGSGALSAHVLEDGKQVAAVSGECTKVSDLTPTP